MTSRARRGLEAFLTRKAVPTTEHLGEVALPDGTPLPLRIRRHPTARRMTLRLSPDGNEARATIPRWAPFKEAEVFARTRAEWLQSQRTALPRHAPVGPGTIIAWRGQPLQVEWHTKLPRRPAIVGEILQVGGPQDGITSRIRRWLEAEALDLSRADLTHFCANAAQPVPDIRLSRAQRRWGSCTSDGTVRINWRLVMAPDLVRRSVVAHEVAHLVHFDHSPAFHALLARIFDDDLHAANRWLKQHGRTLYAPFG